MDLFVDITERKKAEAELLQAQKLASIEQLAAEVAHEINNPLMALSSEIHLLLEKSEDEELVESLKLMDKLSKRIAGIVTDLVIFSQVISNNVREPSDINSLIEKSLLLMKERFKLANIEIKKELDKNLPELIVNKEKIEQVFTNVILNSLDAMPNGGKLTISTKFSSTNGGIEIIFIDTGSGIIEEYLDKIFNPLFTTKPSGGRTGLGLSVCHGIIENHGGDIKIDNGTERGTKVLIRLPIEKNVIKSS